MEYDLMDCYVKNDIRHKSDSYRRHRHLNDIFVCDFIEKVKMQSIRMSSEWIKFNDSKRVEFQCYFTVIVVVDYILNAFFVI